MASRPSIWGRVYGIVTPYRGRLIVSMVTLLCLMVLGLTSPRLSAKLIGKALPELDAHLFITCVIALFGINVLSNVLSFLYSYQMRVLGGRVVFDLRRRMYDHLQRLSLGFYESRSSGEIVSDGSETSSSRRAPSSRTSADSRGSRTYPA